MSMGGKKSPMKVVEVTMKRHIPLERKVCQQCGKSFLGIKRARYCSAACVNKAAYWRRPEVYRQKRRESYQRQKVRAAKE